MEPNAPKRRPPDLADTTALDRSLVPGAGQKPRLLVAWALLQVTFQLAVIALVIKLVLDRSGMPDPSSSPVEQSRAEKSAINSPEKSQEMPPGQSAVPNTAVRPTVDPLLAELEQLTSAKSLFEKLQEAKDQWDAAKPHFIKAADVVSKSDFNQWKKDVEGLIGNHKNAVAEEIKARQQHMTGYEARIAAVENRLKPHLEPLLYPGSVLSGFRVLLVGVNSNDLPLDSKYARAITFACNGLRTAGLASSKYRLNCYLYTGEQLEMCFRSDDPNSKCSLPGRPVGPTDLTKIRSKLQAEFDSHQRDDIQGGKPLERRIIFVVSATTPPPPQAINNVRIDALLVGPTMNLKVWDDWKRFTGQQWGIAAYHQVLEPGLPSPNDVDQLEFRLKQLLHPLVAELKLQ